MEKEEKFFPRNQLAHPKSTIVLKNVSKANLLKLQVWVDRHDRIEALPCPSSKEVYLLNQSTWPAQKNGPWSDRQYDKFVEKATKT